MLYKYFDKVKQNCFSLVGSGTCIAKSSLASGSKNASNINLYVQQFNLHDYNKVLFNTSADASYHIAGYGQSNEEAITRALGETVERYAYMSMYFLIKDKIINASYEELVKKSDVLPLEYINICKVNNKLCTDLLNDEKTNWLELVNLCNNKKMYYPVDLICSQKGQRKISIPNMSTGTAVHISQQKALLNAMIEQLQIHLFLTHWYSGIKFKRVDWKKTCSKELEKIVNSCFTNESEVEIEILYCGIKEINFKTFVTILKGKTRYPFCAIGVQGGFNSEETLLRSVMEAASIYVNLQAFYVFKKDEIEKLNKETVMQEMNLDAPFLYWSNYNDIELKTNHLKQITDYTCYDFLPDEVYSEKEQLKIIVDYYKKNLKYFSVIDITPIEAKKCGYSAVRVIAPELIPMNMSGITYDRHPYFIKNGGIKNGYITQPLP